MEKELYIGMGIMFLAMILFGLLIAMYCIGRKKLIKRLGEEYGLDERGEIL